MGYSLTTKACECWRATLCWDVSDEGDKLCEGSPIALGVCGCGHGDVRGDMTRALECLCARRDVIPSAVVRGARRNDELGDNERWWRPR